MGRKAKPQEERRATRRATQRNYNRDNAIRRAGPSNITAEAAPFNQGPESPLGRPRPRHPPPNGSLRQNPTATKPTTLFNPTAEDNHPRINPRKRPAASSPRSRRSRPKAPSTSSTANNVLPSTGTDTRSQSIDLSSRSNSLNQIIERDTSHPPNIRQGPEGVNNTILHSIPQLQSRSSTRASLRTASSTSRVTAVRIPLSTSTLTSVNIPSHSTFPRPTSVTNPLPLDDDSPGIARLSPEWERNRSTQSERFPAPPWRQPLSLIIPTLHSNRSPAALPSQSSTTASARTHIALSASRPHNTLPLDDGLPDHDDPLESGSAVSRPSDPDAYDESAASPEDDLSGLSLSDEAPDPKTAAQDCLDRSWAPLCTCRNDCIGANGARSLAECTDYLNEHLPGVPFPLQSRIHLRRRGQHNDFREVDWQELLGGRSNGDVPEQALSIARSAEAFERAEQRTDPWVRRSYDVDSFMARVTTLAVHRKGFRLAYRPPYLRTITQDPHVTFRSRGIHMTKHLRLGYGVGSAGFNYECYVFFPRMTRTKKKQKNHSYHLSSKSQQIWIDDIILPALRSTCDAQVRARHPGSFEDANCKAHVKHEVHNLPPGQAMDLSYPIPSHDLDAFWREVCREADDRPLFKNPFLVVQGHDLKICTSRPTPTQARDDFLAHLDDCFDFREEYFPPGDCWLDFGVEDTPRGDTSQAISLLRKPSCLEHWAEAFHDPSRGATGTKESKYPWFLTRDAGSMSVEVLPRNYLHRKCGIAYPKAYNLIKHLFDTPLKKHGPFQNPHFEALGFSQSNLDRWYEANHKGSSSARRRKHEQLVRQYNTTKIRLQAALKSAEDTTYRPPRPRRRRQPPDLGDYALDDPPTSDDETCSPHGSDNDAPAPRRVPPDAPKHKAANFGARQECRMNLTRFRTMSFDAVDDDGSALSPMLTRVNDHSGSHRRRTPHFPYWILPTAEVLQFIAATTNRWLLHLEVIMTRLEGGVGDLTAMTWKDEQMHGVMVMAIVRTLALSFGGDDPRKFPHRPLWRDDWTMSRPRRDHKDGTPTVRLGLGYRRSVDTYGMVWVRADLMRWLPLPYFSQHALENLGLTQDHNAFQKSFRRPRIANLLNKEHYFYSRWRERCKTYLIVPRAYEPLERWVGRTLDLAAQLVVKEYNLEVFDILAKRCYIAKKDWKAAVQSRNTGPCPVQDEWPSKAKQKEHFLAQMDEDSRNGFCMLTPGLVTRITGARPHLIHAKAPGSNGKGAFFAPYHGSGLWEDRVRALFGFDEPELQGRRRKWERCKFRTLVKQLWTIFDQTFEHTMRQPAWMDRLGRRASKLMLIIPQYDADHLSCIQKAKDGNAVETRQKINKTPMVQRTNWLSCRLEDEYHEFVDWVDRAVNDYPTQKAIRDILRCCPLQTLTNTNSSAAKHPHGVFHDLDLDGLDDTFHEAEVHHMLAEEDSRKEAGEVDSEPKERMQYDSSSSDE